MTLIVPHTTVTIKLTLVHQLKKVTHMSIVDKNDHVKKTVIKIGSLGVKTCTPAGVPRDPTQQGAARDNS